MVLLDKHFPVEGQRGGFCKQCHGQDDKPWYHHEPMRALYVRFSGKFERIGWIFERCGHVEIDREKYRSLDADVERVKKEKYDEYWKGRLPNTGSNEDARA